MGFEPHPFSTISMQFPSNFPQWFLMTCSFFPKKSPALCLSQGPMKVEIHARGAWEVPKLRIVGWSKTLLIALLSTFWKTRGRPFSASWRFERCDLRDSWDQLSSAQRICEIGWFRWFSKQGLSFTYRPVCHTFKRWDFANTASGCFSYFSSWVGWCWLLHIHGLVGCWLYEYIWIS